LFSTIYVSTKNRENIGIFSHQSVPQRDFSCRCYGGARQIFEKQHKPQKAGRYEVVLTVFANL
jgi:hypothetical protein